MQKETTLTQLVQKIEVFFRVCSNCGHKADNNSTLCIYCNRVLNRYAKNSWVSGYKHSTLALWEWGEKDEAFVRTAVSALKGGGPISIYDELANKLINLRLTLDVKSKFEVPYFVPAPGKNTQKRDHAEMLAHACARLFHEKSHQLLKRVGRKDQKKKTRVERYNSEEVSIFIEDKFWQRGLGMSRKFVFVDDVITSGSTAEQAYKALNSPRNFEVWTLFHRPRLL